MKTTIRQLMPFSLLLLASPLLAENVSEAERIVCATSTAVICVETGECFRIMPDEIDLPRFILVDTKKHTLSTTRLSDRPRKTEVERFLQEDGRILMQGMDQGRAYSLGIEEDVGLLTGIMAKDGVTLSVFGDCTDARLK